MNTEREALDSVIGELLEALTLSQARQVYAYLGRLFK